MLNFVYLPVICVLVGLVFIAPRRDRAVGRGVSLALALIVLCGNDRSGLWQGSFAGAAIFMVLGYLASAQTLRPVGRRVVVGTSLWWIYLTLTASFFARSTPLYHLAVEVPVLVLLAWCVTRMGHEDFLTLWRAILFLGVFEVVWGVRDEVTQSSIWGYDAGPNLLPGLGDLIRVGGTLYHPIVYSMFLVLALVVVWANPTRQSQRLRIVIAVLLVGGLLMSGSRSALIAAILALAMHVILVLDATRWVRNLLLLAATTVVGWALLNDEVHKAWTQLRSSTSYTQRTSSLSGLRPLLDRSGADKWFGTGFGDQEALYSQHLLYSVNGSVTVDNMLIYLLGTMGIIGFILFAAYGLWMWFSADRLGRALIFGMAVYFFSFDVLTWVNATFVLTLAMAAGVVRKRLHDREKPVELEPELPSSGPPKGTPVPMGSRWSTA